MNTPVRQPRLRANDWTPLSVPSLGEWTPRLSVSVVIPAYHAAATLPYTLAALKGQSYPQELLEVIVVDDGSMPALELPELRPANTRIVVPSASWGRAHACAVGADAADGDVIHWLDSDMVPYRHHVEAQMRWHHLVDYAVVLGHKMFVNPDPSSWPSPDEVFTTVSEDRAADLFPDEPTFTHDWVEATYERTADLSTAAQQAYTVHVGATASVPTAVYRECGGMDSALKLGEDIELGYRLAQVGAVFIPDRQAQSWHLGPTQVMRRREEVNRYNAPYLTDRISQLRWRRQDRGRTYSVPYVQVVVDTHDAGYEQVAATVNALLGSTLSDLSINLLGEWTALDDSRRHPIDDPAREARLVQAAYAGDARVSFVESFPVDAFPSAFQMSVPAGWRVSAPAVETLLKDMERSSHGVRQILLADGQVAWVRRTAAVRRAAHVLDEGEDVVDVLDELFGSWWSSGEDDGFRDYREPATPGEAESSARLQAEVASLRRQLREAGSVEATFSKSAQSVDVALTAGGSRRWWRRGTRSGRQP
jgi:glycosyltransferase involved in cell wall biosynthesis